MNSYETQFSSNFKKKVLQAVIKAGQIAKNCNENKIKIWEKSESQPVTNADIEINKFLKAFFKKLTPSFGWLSEESKDDFSRKNKNLFWCVDPIDGTRSFIKGKPEYTISVALIKKTIPIIGIIYNPLTEELFFAEKNRGAFCNNNKIIVSKTHHVENCKIAISSSEEKIIQNFKLFKHLNAIKMGSIAYKIALVAKGEIDIALSFTKKNDWDLAAAFILLNEAGGIVTNLNGNKINFNTDNLRISDVLACNKILNKKIVIKTASKV
tara:strand:+ start:4017 stop:4817 length:801 start_codon:yes stop_codon:yes gene_type:complete